ncbi:hypothetical protein [uncultured Acinetobacter sp.]|uniref:hypothetical protein n=1 Tax=uncultured Acinetobacter sp. TaxID=165433 RepID=UPI00374950DC
MMSWDKIDQACLQAPVFVEREKSEAKLRKRLEMDLVATIEEYSEVYGLKIENILFHCDKTIDVRVGLKGETTDIKAETPNYQDA